MENKNTDESSYNLTKSGDSDSSSDSEVFENTAEEDSDQFEPVNTFEDLESLEEGTEVQTQGKKKRPVASSGSESGSITK